MPLSTQPLLILGSGGFALDVADFAQDSGAWTPVGLVQNRAPQPPSSLEDLPLYWIEDARRQHPDAWAVCALGSQQRDAFTAQAESMGFRFATLIHPFTRVSQRAQIEVGAIVSPGAIIAAGAHIGASRRADHRSFHVPGGCGSRCGRSSNPLRFVPLTASLFRRGIESYSFHGPLGFVARCRDRCWSLCCGPDPELAKYRRLESNRQLYAWQCCR